MHTSPTNAASSGMISVVLPVYNEAGNILSLIAEIFDAAVLARCEVEILAVDDASTDNTLTVLSAAAAADARIRVVAHGGNFGQSAALASGFAVARGAVIVTLDADGQNDPADLPLLLNALTEDVAAVCGVRQGRKDNWVRRISSTIGNGFRNMVTGDYIQDAGCAFRAVRRDRIRELPVFNGMHRFLPTLLRYQGLRVVEVPVHHRPRLWGKSKYGIRNRLFRGLADCLAMRWWRKRSLPADRLACDDAGNP